MLDPTTGRPLLNLDTTEQLTKADAILRDAQVSPLAVNPMCVRAATILVNTFRNGPEAVNLRNADGQPNENAKIAALRYFVQTTARIERESSTR